MAEKVIAYKVKVVDEAGAVVEQTATTFKELKKSIADLENELQNTFTKGGSVLNTNASLTYTNTAGNFPIYAFNFNISNAPYSNGYANQRLGFLCFGGRLSASEALCLNNAIITFNTTLGRIL